MFLGTLTIALALSLAFTWLRPPEYHATALLRITAASGSPALRGAAGSVPESAKPFLTEVQVLTRQHLQLARVEPAFEHRDDLDHDAEVRCVIGVLEQQPQPALQGIDRVGPLVGMVEAPRRSLALIVGPFSIFIPVKPLVEQSSGHYFFACFSYI